MKKNNILFIAAAMIVLSSCAKKNIGYFNNQYESVTSKKETPAIVEPTASNFSNIEENPYEENATSSILAIPDLKPETSIKLSVKSVATPDKLISGNDFTPSHKITGQSKNDLKKNIKKLAKADREHKANRSFIGGLLLVILAIILPPLAVLIVDGISGPFWLSILLTILFWVPGIIYALIRICKKR